MWKGASRDEIRGRWFVSASDVCATGKRENGLKKFYSGQPLFSHLKLSYLLPKVVGNISTVIQAISDLDVTSRLLRRDTGGLLPGGNLTRRGGFLSGPITGYLIDFKSLLTSLVGQKLSFDAQLTSGLGEWVSI